MERKNQTLIDAFAETLRNRRQAARLSQEELATRADISTRFISFLETGRRQPTLSALLALSTGLGVTMSELACQAGNCIKRKYEQTDGCA